MDARKRRATKPTSPDSQAQPHQQSSSSTTAIPSSSAASKNNTKPEMDAPIGPSWRQHWMFFAVASGACAAFNGVFAKLYVLLPFSISPYNQ